MDPIEFQILDWNYYNYENDEGGKDYHIRIFGRTRDDKSIHVDVTGFRPYFYVKLEKTWRQNTMTTILNKIREKIYPRENMDGLISYKIVEKYDFYGFSNYTKYEFMKLEFSSYDSMISYNNAFKKKLDLKSVSYKPIKFQVYESNIEPHIRCMHTQDLDSVGWVRIEKYKNLPETSDIMSCCNINIHTKYTNLIKIDDRTISPFKIAGFDIECMSEDGSFPQPKRDGDQIIQIGTTFSRFGDSECYRKVIFTLKSCNPIEGVEVKSFENEVQLMRAWTKLLEEEDPDIITGYNILGFDFNYMKKRSKKLGIFDTFSKLSRIKEEITVFKKTKLASSALGDNLLKYYDMTGRVIIDLMKVIQRDHKLASYKLDYVSSYFIREMVLKLEPNPDKKETMIITKGTYGIKLDQYITIFYNDGITENKHMDGKKFKVKQIEKDKLLVDGLIDLEVMTYGYKVFWCQAKDDVGPQDIFKFQLEGPAERAIIAKYCVMDCELCNKLVAKLQIIPNNIGMANVCNVPFSYIFMRGQGVKIFSLVSKECRILNHLIPVLKKKQKKEKEEDKEEGDNRYTNIVENYDSRMINQLVEKLNNKHRESNEENDDDDNEDENGYEGAIVFEPRPGVYYEPIPVLDYNSLYPSSMIQRNLSHECNINTESRDKEFGYLKEYKYHEITFNTVMNVKEIIKENEQVDMFNYIINIFIPRSLIQYEQIIENKYKITIEYRKKEKEELIVKDKTLRNFLNTIIKNNAKYIKDIMTILSDNLPRIVRNLTKKEIEMIHDIENSKYKFFTKIYNKRRLWIELDYTEDNAKIIIYTICKFAEKEDGTKGIIPQILQKLLDARKHFKNLMDDEKDSFKKTVLDGLQLAYKVTANSLYGQTGAPTSSIYMKEIAASTTATGREMLQFSKHFIEKIYGPMINLALTDNKAYKEFVNNKFDKFPHMVKETINGKEIEFMVHLEDNVKLPEKKFIDFKKRWTNKEEYFEYFSKIMNDLFKGYSLDPIIIYGDSVTGDTPLVLRNTLTESIEIITIESLNNIWHSYIDEKEFNEVNNYEVWTERGWTRINKIIRHKTTKNIYEILTHTGFVKVTEDHSLIKNDNSVIKPKDCVLGTNLLHSYPNLINKEIDNKLENIINKNDSIKAATIYSIAKMQNLNVIIDSDDTNFKFTFTNDEITDPHNIKKINNLGVITDYVYDLETENHHFAAGIGEIIVHNTDSVFFNPRIKEISSGKIINDKKSLELAIQLGIWASEMICKLLPDPQKQAYEKVLYPFAILSKKRYIGNLYETDPNKYYQKSMGIVLKRRDNAPIVKIVYGGIIETIINKKDAKGAVEYTRNILRRILGAKYPIDKFIITKTLKETYKDRTRIVHAVLADRMGLRDAGNKPMPNDRIPYVYIETKNDVKLQGDRVEHPDYVIKRKLRIDYLFYITNQIMKPCIQFLDLVVEDAEEIFRDYIIREENRRDGIQPITAFIENNIISDEEDNDFKIDEDEMKLVKKEIKKTSSKKKPIVKKQIKKQEVYEDSDDDIFKLI